jgi:polysaccharide export outer membrane protein
LGFTADEISSKIKEGLSKYFVNTDEIFITVKLAGFKYTILGEVGSTGTIVLFQNSLNIVEAIANAGDISLTGDKKNIEVIRQNIDGVQKFKLDMTSMQVFNSEVFYLQPNDIIYVPPLKQKTFGTGTNGVQTLTTIVSVLSLLTTSYLLIKNL